MLSSLLVVLVLGPAHAGVPSRMPDELVRGQTLYRQNCWQCHGAAALGQGPVAAALPTPPPALAGRAPEAEQQRQVELIQSGQGDMPGFSSVFDRHDARRVLKWLASLDPVEGAPPEEPEPEEPAAEGDDDEGDAQGGDEQPGPGKLPPRRTVRTKEAPGEERNAEEE